MDTDAFFKEEEEERGKRPDYKITGQNIRLEKFRSFCRNGCSASDEHFEAISVAQFAEDSPPEVWIITDKKEIHQAQNGSSK